MQLKRLPVNERAVAMNRRVERVVNRVVRARDRWAERLGVGGRAAAYDDTHYEFIGGAKDELRKKHYDKSLRLLWKAEAVAPWSSFRDCTDEERLLLAEAERSLSPEERAERKRITSEEYRAFLDEHYTPRQKRAIVSFLAAIGHGEAYAWLVSASLLSEVKSTGARAALTMQVLEEAKHFVVMRELVQAFGVEVPRQSVWEYLLLEGTLKAKGLDKFFGMNVLVETIALSIFGSLSEMPGLEILRLFHLDEARHTALPANYFKEFPLDDKAKASLRSRVRRLWMTLPALPLVMLLEEELAEIGIDAFEFAGSVMRKVSALSERAGLLPAEVALRQAMLFNRIFNLYCRATRPGHEDRDFMAADTTSGEEERAVEREIFAAATVH